jgi:poly-beta-1,6-N-acetyl-D-glucosamine synthase
MAVDCGIKKWSDNVMQIVFWISISLLIYSYLFYPVFVWVLSKIIPKQRIQDHTLRPSVSMLIAAFNEEENITNKIQNFMALDYPIELKELLIGSDGSTDKTNDLLKKNESKTIRTFCYNSRSGKAAVLNRLSQEATGDILIFSDANTMYDKHAIKMLVRHFADDKIGGVNGCLILINPKKNTGSKGEQTYWKYENILKKAEGKIKTVLGANGGIYAMRKDIYIPLPEHKVIVDDFLVALNAVKQGFDVIYDNDSWATETISPSIKGDFTRKVRIGAGNFNILSEIKSLLNPSKGWIAFTLWSHKIIRWFVPFLLFFIFISNLQLLDHPFYLMLFLFQILFYTVAVAGYFLSKHNFNNKLFMYPLYFTATNLALSIGFFKAITKAQKPAWSSVERS